MANMTKKQRSESALKAARKRKRNATKNAKKKSVKRNSSPRKTVKARVRTVAKKLNSKELIANGVIAIGGAIASAAIATRIPAPDPKLKAALPLLMGVGALATKQGRKNKMIVAAALGAMVAGGLAVTKQINPNIPLLAGEDDYYDELEEFPMGGPVLAGPVMMGEASLLGFDDGYNLSGNDGYNY